MKKLFIVLTSIFLMLGGCTTPQESESFKVAMVQPGTSIKNLGFISYDKYREPDSMSITGSPNPLPTMCDFVKNIGSLALVEFNVGPRTVPLKDDCSGPYSGFAKVYSASVLAVAAGQELSIKTDLIILEGGGLPRLPQQGETWLMTIRQSDGEWFYAGGTPVVFNESEIESDQQRLVSMPNTFEELSIAAINLVEDFESECPTEALETITDEDWRIQNFDPNFLGCTPKGAPEVLPEDMSAENCIDDDLCD